MKRLLNLPIHSLPMSNGLIFKCDLQTRMTLQPFLMAMSAIWADVRLGRFGREVTARLRRNVKGLDLPSSDDDYRRTVAVRESSLKSQLVARRKLERRLQESCGVAPALAVEDGSRCRISQVRRNVGNSSRPNRHEQCSSLELATVGGGDSEVRFVNLFSGCV